jgi:hypothetical protein
MNFNIILHECVGNPRRVFFRFPTTTEESEAAHLRVLRELLGLTKLDKRRNTNTRGKLQVNDIVDTSSSISGNGGNVRQERLKIFSHYRVSSITRADVVSWEDQNRNGEAKKL